MTPDAGGTETTVEFYAGQKADETPRAIVREGRRIEIARVLARERKEDAAGGSRREVWRVLLADGRTATIELLESGARRVIGVD
jgi:hypothetical protein